MRRALGLVLALLVGAQALAASPMWRSYYDNAGTAWGITTCPSGYVVGGPAGGAPAVPACVPINYSYVGIYPDYDVQMTGLPFGQSYLSGLADQIVNNTFSLVQTPGEVSVNQDTVAKTYTFGLASTTGGTSLSGSAVHVYAYRAKDRMLMLAPPSGSFGNNGVLTLNTALPATNACSGAHGGCYMSFPAGAIATGVPTTDTWYYTICTSVTVCTVYNNTYTAPGLPTAPASPTAFVTTGPGAYAATTTALSSLQLTIPGGSMGTGGRVNFTAVTMTTNSATSKTTRFIYGGTLFAQYSQTTSVESFFQLSIWNQYAGEQVASSFVLGQATTGALTFASIDTTADQTLTINLLTNNVADYVGLVVCDVEITQ